jgi:hypothetical protein
VTPAGFSQKTCLPTSNRRGHVKRVRRRGDDGIDIRIGKHVIGEGTRLVHAVRHRRSFARVVNKLSDRSEIGIPWLGAALEMGGLRDLAGPQHPNSKPLFLFLRDMLRLKINRGQSLASMRTVNVMPQEGKPVIRSSESARRFSVLCSAAVQSKSN